MISDNFLELGCAETTNTRAGPDRAMLDAQRRGNFNSNTAEIRHRRLRRHLQPVLAHRRLWTGRMPGGIVLGGMRPARQQPLSAPANCNRSVSVGCGRYTSVPSGALDCSRSTVGISTDGAAARCCRSLAARSLPQRSTRTSWQHARRSAAAPVVASAAAVPAPAPAAASWPGVKPVPLLLSLSVGLALRFLVPVPDGITMQGWTLLSIFCSTIAGLVLDPLPVGAWAFLAATVAVATRTLTFAATFSAFTNDVIWLIVVSFFFARVSRHVLAVCSGGAAPVGGGMPRWAMQRGAG